MMDDLANINTEHEAENAFNSTEACSSAEGEGPL